MKRRDFIRVSAAGTAVAFIPGVGFVGCVSNSIDALNDPLGVRRREKLAFDERVENGQCGRVFLQRVVGDETRAAILCRRQQQDIPADPRHDSLDLRIGECDLPNHIHIR